MTSDKHLSILKPRKKTLKVVENKTKFQKQLLDTAVQPKIKNKIKTWKRKYCIIKNIIL